MRASLGHRGRFRKGFRPVRGRLGRGAGLVVNAQAGAGRRNTAELRGDRDRWPRGRGFDRAIGARGLLVIVTGWRIYKKRLGRTAFTGEGARRFGGRWNSPGPSVIYLAQSQAQAAPGVVG